MKPIPTREQLELTLNLSSSPEEKGWEIYRYLKENIGDKIDSTEARTWLSKYLSLSCAKPSLLHSLMLGLAIKMADAYPDFKLPSFVSLWDIANLRTDDLKRSQDDQGRMFHSLAERLSASMMRYMTTHPGEDIGASILTLVQGQARQLGFLPIQPMVAIKMFETETDGRKNRMVKLIGADGQELASDWRPFHSKPWEIVGKMYSVLPRVSQKTENIRIDTIGPSTVTAEEVFGRVIGYVDSYDEKHKHYHIYDNQSRHFVAESPAIRPAVGGYVWIAPVVPAQDNFKSAIVLANETKAQGRQAFGCLTAKVIRINTEKGYFTYMVEEGAYAYANIKAADHPLAIGQTVHMTIYQRRGPNGQKRPYVADAYQ